jgi:SAM-dependent methyltransferase
VPDVDPTTRFSDRVENYVLYRPGYPAALAQALQRDVGLARASMVADIGSGTGASAEMLLGIGCEVFAVEPNAEMRKAAEARLGHETRFHSVAARAEATTLDGGRLDAITAGQAFHWFAVRETRSEFARILRPHAPVALFWNTRRTEGSPFLEAYEQLLHQFGTDYAKVNHRNVDAAALRVFFGGPYQSRVFSNEQAFDYDGLHGRLLSSSYAPGPGHPSYEAMAAALRQLFDRHQHHGRVRMEYETELFFGPLGVET